MKRSPWVELFLVAAAFLTVRPLAIAETGKAMVREGGGTFFGTDVGYYLPQRNYTVTYVTTGTIAAVNSEIALNKVFVFNGHGNSSDITIDYNNSVFMSYTDVSGAENYKLVFLNSCSSCANSNGDAWKSAFRATSVVGWSDLVSDWAADEFDDYFWYYVCIGNQYTGAAVVSCMYQLGYSFTLVPHPVANGSAYLF